MRARRKKCPYDVIIGFDEVLLCLMLLECGDRCMRRQCRCPLAMP